MRRLQGLNYHRGEKYKQLLLTKARADAEKLKLAAAEEAAPKVDTRALTSDPDSLEVMLLDELKNDADDVKTNSMTENVAGGIHSSDTESEALPFPSGKDIDYSINPPVPKMECTDPLPGTSNSTFVAIKIEMDTADSAGIDAEHTTGSTSNGDVLVNANIRSDEAMVLPATGSDNTLVTRNNTITAIDENVNTSLSQDTTLHLSSTNPESIVTVEVTSPTEFDTTDQSGGKNINCTDTVLKPTTVIRDDLEVLVKQENS
jgi:hypothetical protein